MANIKHSLAGKVCIVTGATRGIGKGIALQLGEKGAKVYITGRTVDPPNGSKVGGSLRETAEEIKARGGDCIPVQCDHSKDEDIERLFEQVKRENDGQLDVLVNNAYSAVNAVFNNIDVQFWDQPASMWDTVNNVGLRNHYICSVYAARMMVPRKQGLIVNVSSPGGLRYLFNTAYGIGKEACDRMAADCGHELYSSNVAFISLWPGPVGTEELMSSLSDNPNEPIPKQALPPGMKKSSRARIQNMFQGGETAEYVGQCISALATDPNIMKKSGKIVLTCDVGKEHGLKDKDGHVPLDMCSVKANLKHLGYPWLATMTPSFLRIPKWVLALAGNKFY